MVDRSLRNAMLVFALTLASLPAAWSQRAANNNAIPSLSRCAPLVDRIDEFNRCEDSLAAAAKLAPEIARAFLAWCTDHAQACEDRIVIINRRNHVKATWTCWIAVRDNAKLPEVARSILDWLAQHPEATGNATDDAVTAAITALWPC